MLRCEGVLGCDGVQAAVELGQRGFFGGEGEGANAPAGDDALHGFEAVHFAAGEGVGGADVGGEDLRELGEVFGIEGEAVEGEEVADCEGVVGVGWHFGRIFGRIFGREAVGCGGGVGWGE